MEIRKLAFLITAFVALEISSLSQTPPPPKPSFEVISIKPSAPNLDGRRGGSARGNRYTMTGATLKMLLQSGYPQTAAGQPAGQLQIIGGPPWMDSDRYDIQATMDCSGGPLSRDQVQLMIQSMLEDRFQLRAHIETRELPIYNLVVGKDGPKIKASADQTPPSFQASGPQYCGPVPANPPAPFEPPSPPGQRGSPSDPNFVLPRGSMMMMMNPTGLTMQATAVPLSNTVSMLQQQVGLPSSIRQT